MALLEGELDKVFTFQKIKSEEIVSRIKESQKAVDSVLRSTQTRAGPTPPPPRDEDFLILEEYLSDIIADVHDLAKYVQLNYTGFQKIIKKHDVSIGHRSMRPPILVCITSLTPFSRNKRNGS